jgi:glycosyltransferase involved in cell wall biosynthesis
MKILHCVAGNLYGGVETLLTTLARGRAHTPGIESAFAVCFEGRLSAQLRDLGAEVHRLGAVRFSRPWTLLKARDRLRDLQRRYRPDVVVCHSAWPHAAFAPVARRAGVPVVFWMHDVPSGTHWLERLARRVRPDLVLANSLYTASAAPRLFPGLRPEVLYCPVEPPEPLDRARVRAEVRAELDTDPDATVLVLASRLEPLKGHAVLLEALARFSDRADWVLWIAGGVQRPHEQVYLATLQDQARQLGLADRVLWLGYRSDVRRLLVAADLLCQPNVGPESYGIAFVEALYAGLPVVSTRLGGACEIIDESCGLLVEPGNPGALAEALRSLLDNASLRSRLGTGGPARAASLSDPARVLNRLSVLLGHLPNDGPTTHLRSLQTAGDRP